MANNDYREFVHGLAANKTDMIFLNSDEDKMLSVFVEMFNSAKKEFRIFAGSLCNKTTNSNGYIEAISNYIEKKGELYILLNEFDRDKVYNNLFKRLAYYQSMNYNIKIKSTKAKITYHDNPAHFAVGDRISYRIETDIKKRSAVCNMYSPEFSESLIRIFDKIFNDERSIDVDLLGIFNIRE